MLTCHMRKSGDPKQGVRPAMDRLCTKMKPTALPPRAHEKGPGVAARAPRFQRLAALIDGD